MISKGKTIVGITLFVIGIVIAARPLAFIEILNFIIGAAIVLVGITTILTKRAEDINKKKLVAITIGGLEIVIGVWLLFNPSILIIGLSLLFLLNGIRKSIEIVTLPKENRAKIFSFILAVLNLGIAVFIFYYFEQSLGFIFKAIGYFLIAMGAIEYIQGYKLSRIGM